MGVAVILVDFRGNKGNRNGDGPAAQRYTEARMSELASLTLERLNKESVKFKPNYANDQDEPEVLPIPIPLLLIMVTMVLLAVL